MPQSETGGGYECLGMFYRSYHYNKDTGECEHVTYAGCGRTANNFNTLKDCEEACVNEMNFVLS